MSNDAARAIVRAEHLLAVEPFISTEETRYYLNGIYIEPHPEGGAIFVTTDGHMMAVVYDPEALVTGTPRIWHKNIAGKGTLKCPMDTWNKQMKPKVGRARISRQTSKDPKPPQLHWCDLQSSLDSPESVSLVYADSANTVLLGNGSTYFTRQRSKLGEVREQAFTIDATYPDYRRVVPTHEGVTTFSPSFFQARYLDKAATFGTAVWDAAHPDDEASKSMPVCIRAASAQDPAIIRFSGVPNAFLVIMPVRDSDGLLGDTLPAWFTGKNNVVPLKKAA